RLEVGQRGIARPEVVDDDADALRLQALDVRQRVLRAADEAVFRYFQLEPAGRKLICVRRRSRRCANSGSLNWTADMLTAILRCAGQSFAASSVWCMIESEISPIRPLDSATLRNSAGSSRPLAG